MTSFIKILFVFMFFISFSVKGLDTQNAENLHQLKIFHKLSEHYITWTDYKFKTKDSPFIFAVLGKDPFGTSLEKFYKGKTIKGRKVFIQRYKTIEDVQFSHILYVAHTAENLTKLLKPHTLLIGTGEDFIDKGGMIGFVIFKDKYRFQLNYKVANCANIKISPKLARYAKKIIKEGIKDEKD